MRIKLLLLIVSAALVTGCSTNPVTGERQLVFGSTQQDIAMGAQAYEPSQQSQGGEQDLDPALSAYVSGVGQKLAAASGVDLPYEFVVLNNSVPNAWALPGGKIAINRGLLTELNSEAELAAVLGHEVVHAAARHSAQQMSRGMLAQVLVVGTAIATSDSDYGNLAVGGANLGAGALLARYGRGAELESDRYGMQYMSRAGYDPRGAITLQETFVRLSEGRRTDWLSGLFASHPPSEERVAANRATAASLPPGGKMGIEEYERAMAKTMAAKPAYDAYDEGRKALAEGDIDKAAIQANKALEMLPAEAHFHALRGDVRLKQEDLGRAETNYSRAIERRNDFFYYHLQRGLVRRERGRTDSAVIDLERSLELLPTAPAHYALGTIKAERGNIDAALDHYRVVAKSGGEYGKRATAAMLEHDLPRNPGSYVPHRCVADANGNLVVQVQNGTAVPITGVDVVVSYSDSAGRQRQVTQAVRGVIPPGQIASANTGLGPYSGGNCPARVASARIAE